MIVIAINDLKMTAAAVEILLQIKSFVFIFLFFQLLARKGLDSPKVETYLSYIDLELARMEPTLKDYTFFVYILFKCPLVVLSLSTRNFHLANCPLVLFIYHIISLGLFISLNLLYVFHSIQSSIALLID